MYGLVSQIKWPIYVLIERQKVTGVLAEAHWSGSSLAAVILGVGTNVGHASIDESVLSRSAVLFPATCLEDRLGKPVDRLELLREILSMILAWRARLATPEFLQAWEARLAFRGEWVQVSSGQSPGKDGLPHDLEELPVPVHEGQVIGLAPDGSLRLRTRTGETVMVHVGEVRLAPV